MGGALKNYVALLRGVTPTGKNKVPMAELREALAQTALGEVRTYIQSGNVLVRTSLTAPDIETIIHDTIRDRFGGDLVVVAMTADELRRVLAGLPFADADPARTYFTLLNEVPSRERAAVFAATDFSPERVRLIGKTIYTVYATKHSDSKFNNNVFERRLKVAATTRNWNTITALIEGSRVPRQAT